MKITGQKIYTIAFVLFLSITALVYGKEDKDLKSDKKPETTAPKLTLSVSPQKVHVGDRINVTLHFYIGEKSKIDLEKSMQSFKDLTIIKSNFGKDKFELEIFADKTEDFLIGPFTLFFTDHKDESNMINSKAIQIKVVSQIGKDISKVEPKPIRDIIPIVPVWLKYFKWIIIPLLIICLVIGIFLYLRKYQKGKDAHLLQRQPYELALDEIQKLKKKKYFDKGEYKAFYFKLSGIMRRYMEEIRDFPAFELTTEEISRKIYLEEDRQLLELLKDADMVKFANHIPITDRDSEDIKRALSYIQKTRPKEQQQESAVKTSKLNKKVNLDYIKG